MSELELNLNEFKEITIKVLSNLEEGEFDPLDELLKQRGNVIKKICELNCSNLEFKTKFEELGLVKLDEKMKNTLIEKRENIKYEIEKLNKSKNSIISYNKDFYRSSGVFSKKV